MLYCLWYLTPCIATTLDIDNVPATSHPVDATTEASVMGMNSDRFTNMDDIFAETIDTDMIETLFNSLGSGIAFSDDIISWALVPGSILSQLNALMRRGIGVQLIVYAIAW